MTKAPEIKFPETITAVCPGGKLLKAMEFELVKVVKVGFHIGAHYKAKMASTPDLRRVGGYDVNYNDLTLCVSAGQSMHSNSRFDLMEYKLLVARKPKGKKPVVVGYCASLGHVWAKNRKERQDSLQTMANSALQGYNFDRTNPNLIK